MTQLDDKRSGEFVLNTIAWLFIIMIGWTLIFMMLVGYNGARINNGEHCGYETFTNFDGTTTANDSVINNTDDVVLEKFEIPSPEGFDHWDFCFETIVDSDTGLLLHVVDQFNSTQAIVYADNQTTEYCAELNETAILHHNWLGVRCTDCDNTNRLTMREAIGGTPVQRAAIMKNSIFVSNEQPLQYKVIGNKDCRGWVKFLAFWYFAGLIGMILVTGVIYGYKALTDGLVAELLR